MAKQVRFNDSDRDKQLVRRVESFASGKGLSFVEAIRQLCEYALTAKKIQKIIE